MTRRTEAQSEPLAEGKRLPRPINPSVVDWDLRARVEAELEWSERGGFYDIRTGQRTTRDPQTWRDDNDEF